MAKGRRQKAKGRAGREAPGFVRSAFWPFAFFLLPFAFFFSGCSKPSASDSRKPTDVTFYWTCDADGRLEPCGCFTGQHGGLTRVQSFLKSPDADHAPLLADVGNALAGTADYQVIQYRYIRQAFATMGYSALNVGEREAHLPLAELRKLAADSPVPMLSANLVERAGGKLVFAPYRVVEHDGRRVAFVGALGAVPADALGDGLAVEPAKSALARVLPEVRKQADAIVLLMYADEKTIRALADEFYELDLILGGKVPQPSQALTRQNRSVVLWTTNETKALGMFKAGLGGPERFVARGWDIVFVKEQIPQDNGLLAVSNRYRSEIRQTRLAVDDPTHVGDDQVPGVRPPADYAGTTSCAGCHPTAYAKWQQTGHARALESLVARGSDADPSCLSCHTVGLGTASGYQREHPKPELANVGCESCHGPGSEHVSEYRRVAREGGSVLYKYRPIGAQDCTSCHYGEFSRPFDYAQFWPNVRHGKESVSNTKPSPHPLTLSPQPVFLQ